MVPESLTKLLQSPDLFRARWSEQAAREKNLSRIRSTWRANPFAPKVSYGRHRGPAPASTNEAAVLMAILPENNRWVLPLTLRPATMQDHAGQVSFPGGRKRNDESHRDAACREFAEELGCDVQTVNMIGEFDPLYVFASRHRVIPFLGIAECFPKMTPCPSEVDRVLLLPLESLMTIQPIVRPIRRGETVFEIPGFWLDGHWVWGATAIMLGELNRTLQAIAQQP